MFIFLFVLYVNCSLLIVAARDVRPASVLLVVGDTHVAAPAFKLRQFLGHMDELNAGILATLAFPPFSCCPSQPVSDVDLTMSQFGTVIAGVNF